MASSQNDAALPLMTILRRAGLDLSTESAQLSNSCEDEIRDAVIRHAQLAASTLSNPGSSLSVQFPFQPQMTADQLVGFTAYILGILDSAARKWKDQLLVAGADPSHIAIGNNFLSDLAKSGPSLNLTHRAFGQYVAALIHARVAYLLGRLDRGWTVAHGNTLTTGRGRANIYRRAASNIGDEPILVAIDKVICHAATIRDFLVPYGLSLTEGQRADLQDLIEARRAVVAVDNNDEKNGPAKRRASGSPEGSSSRSKWAATEDDSEVAEPPVVYGSQGAEDVDMEL